MNPKKTKTKQTTRTQARIREMDITWRDFSGEGEERNERESTAKKKHN